MDVQAVYREELERAAGIVPELAARLADVPAETVRGIVRHELAHVAAGIEAGHGPVWKVWARRLGTEPSATCALPGQAYVSARIGYRCSGCSRPVHVGPRSRAARALRYGVAPGIVTSRCCHAEVKRAPELDRRGGSVPV